MTKPDPILLFVASQIAPKSLAAYMEKAALRARESTLRSVIHHAKLSKYAE